MGIVKSTFSLARLYQCALVYNQTSKQTSSTIVQNTKNTKIKLIIKIKKRHDNESAIAVICFVCVFLCMQTGGAFGGRCGHYLGPSEKCEGLWEVPPCSTSADLSVWLLWLSGERHHMSVKHTHTYTHTHALTLTHISLHMMKTLFVDRITSQKVALWLGLV